MTFLKPFYVFLALVALQLFPYTGVFLMIVAGGLITGLVAHLVLVLMAFDALTGRGPRWLLLFPALFYGGYYFLYFQQGREIASVTAELAATNPKKIFAFDPDAHSLVMDGASEFVTTHDIPVVYDENKIYQPEGYLSYRLIPRAQCGAVKEDAQSRIHIWGIHSYGAFQKGVCRLQFPQTPPHAIVSIVVDPDPLKSRMKAGVNFITTSVVVGGQTVGAFQTAMIGRLPTFPWLFIGCGLNSARPSWECDAGVIRSNFRMDGTPQGVDMSLYDNPVSIMLGIRKYPRGALDNFRGFAQNGDVLRIVEHERQRVEDQTYAALERVLAGGKTDGVYNLGYALTQNPARLEPYAERMALRLTELESADAPQPGKQEKWRRSRRDEPRALATAIASLSREAFAPLAERMFLLAQRDRFWEEYEALYLRAAEVGPQALNLYKTTFLERRANKTFESLPVLALCRIGVADPVVVNEMKARYAQPDSDKSQQDSQQAALFVALLKFGEAEFLRANEAHASSRDRSWREALFAGRGWTAVGPNNCMTEHWATITFRPEVLGPALVRNRDGWEERAK